MPTEKITNMDIAVFALYSLGGVNRKVHLEDIAQKCYEIAPGRFSWELPQFRGAPDKLAAYYGLADARKKKAGELIKSFGSRGTGKKYQMALAGIQWMKNNEPRITQALKLKSSAAPLRQVRDALRTAKSESAFKKFRANGAECLSVYDLADFLGSSLETSPSRIREKFSEMKNRAEFAEDPEIATFLSACEKHFPDLLHP